MSKAAESDVVALYESSADWYSKTMDAEIELPIYHEVLSGLAQAIEALDGPLVDASCGSGHMLERYHARYDGDRELQGVDLSPSMVALTQRRLGTTATIIGGDMRALPQEDESAAAVINFFAAHHVDEDGAAKAIAECARVLVPGGRLAFATWEGSGAIDYGGHSDLIAFRYTKEQVLDWASRAGLSVVECRVDPVEGMGMDAVYLNAVAP